jgi:hypothetical protein
VPRPGTPRARTPRLLRRPKAGARHLFVTWADLATSLQLTTIKLRTHSGRTPATLPTPFSALPPFLPPLLSPRRRTPDGAAPARVGPARAPATHFVAPQRGPCLVRRRLPSMRVPTHPSSTPTNGKQRAAGRRAPKGAAPPAPPLSLHPPAPAPRAASPNSVRPPRPRGLQLDTPPEHPLRRAQPFWGWPPLRSKPHSRARAVRPLAAAPRPRGSAPSRAPQRAPTAGRGAPRHPVCNTHLTPPHATLLSRARRVVHARRARRAYARRPHVRALSLCRRRLSGP